MAINWYNHHIGDYEKKTKHLTLLEHGCYRQLLDHFYANGGPFLNDIKKIYRIIRANNGSERSATDRVLNEFFVLGSDGLWNQTRAAEEISQYNEIKEIRKKVGAIGGAKTKAKYSAKESPPTPTPTPTIVTEDKSSVTSETTKAASEESPDGKSKSKRKRQPATFISDSFEPDIDSLAESAKLNIDPVATRKEFIDYWRSQGKSMCDWQAAFRNRLRQIARYRAERSARETAGRSGVRDVTGAALHVLKVRQQANS